MNADWKKEIPDAQALKWIQDVVELCRPAAVHVCTGSWEEYFVLCKEMVKKGTLIPLNSKLRPDSFLARSDPDDVARVEECTYICSASAGDAGPTNHWKDPEEMRQTLLTYFNGAMEGRTLYVIPFLMGSPDSPFSIVGIELTDSPYVAVNMKLMTHMGKDVWHQLKKQGYFIPCLHSCGVPLKNNVADVPWPCDVKRRAIVHFPETKEIWSFGSGYGGNALLGKKSLALRIASVMAKESGWLAEHMLILGLTNPKQEKIYIAAAFPSACGKTNLAMLVPTIPGWKVETVGDDIAWMRFDEEGQLYAVNPEAGFFGVAPGTSLKTNPNAMQSIQERALFTNVALTDDGDVYWEGMSDHAPEHLIDWQGRSWTPSKGKAAHPNSRFTVSIKQCPVLDPNWGNPKGVPISAIIFGGRRSTTTPLVVESFSWNHGVFYGASLTSETTAAALGKVGELRHDPFAMLPFAGYHMGDYFAHWIAVGKDKDPLKLPKIFYVNWFRKSPSGEWLWPGFGENIHILKWIFARLQGDVKAQQTPIGNVPLKKDLAISNQAFDELFRIDAPEWLQEVENLEKYFRKFGQKFPVELKQEMESLKGRLSEACHQKSN